MTEQEEDAVGALETDIAILRAEVASLTQRLQYRETDLEREREEKMRYIALWENTWKKATVDEVPF